jgi:DNA-binding NarL/FixJ family response regulator
MTKPRVLIAEDFVPMADALAAWLAPWYEIVGKVHDLSMVAGAIRQTRPDVVLLDLAFKSFSALHELPTLRALPDAPRFLILTAYRDHGLMTGAIDAGASGYVVKASDFSEVKVALDEVLAGRLYLSPSVQPVPHPPRVPSRRRDRRDIEGNWPLGAFEIVLDERQIAVLTHLQQGLSSRDSAKLLGVHRATVGDVIRALGERIHYDKDRDYLLKWFETYMRK